jgi:hypothetical protein
VRSFHGVQETAWFAKDDLRPFVTMLRESVRGAYARAASARR